MLIDGNGYVVRGVLPPEFALRLPPDVGLPSTVDAWSPMGEGALTRDDRPPLLRDQDSDNTGVVVARVRRGATLEAVRAELDGIAASLRERTPEHETAGLRFEVEPESRMSGVEVGELRLPPGAAVSLITRGKDALVPSGRTTLRTGDQVLVVTALGKVDEVEERLRAVSRYGRLAGWYESLEPPNSARAFGVRTAGESAA